MPDVNTDVRTGGPSGPPSDGLPFFPVGTSKFIVLSLATFGIYELFWMYQNWIRIGRRPAEALSPFWRTFFGPVFAFSLFARVRAIAGEHQSPAEWNANILATLYLVLCLSALLPDLWMLISSAAFVPMLPVQQTTQLVNARHPASATEPPNTGYGTGNIITIVVGCLILVLLVVASYLKEATL